MMNKKELALSHVLPILRGLLAGNSGNDDDRFSRAVLSPAAAGRKPFLEIEKWQASDTAETLRAAFKQALEQYRLKHKSWAAFVKFAGAGTFCVQRGGKTPGRPLHNKIALVTGAAGAIGAGICRKLLEEGCLVAAADLNAKALDALVKELGGNAVSPQLYGYLHGAGTTSSRLMRPVVPGRPSSIKTAALRNAPGRVIGVQMDVTGKESVADGFARTIAQWGGVDIVVVNAGIAMVSPLMDMDPEAFRRLEKVNVEGTLLTLAEAGKCMRRQNTGGDIVLISTKNVFAPGAQFGAYSATKAASHQLARIASLEYAPFDIRVNMVAPDAVFGEGQRKSGLWAEVGPSRMKARGLDEKGLEDYYRNRNLLKARVTAEHVANAVIFFASRQTPTTGATIPVDGGLPDSTPR